MDSMMIIWCWRRGEASQAALLLVDDIALHVHNAAHLFGHRPPTIPLRVGADTYRSLAGLLVTTSLLVRQSPSGRSVPRPRLFDPSIPRRIRPSRRCRRSRIVIDDANRIFLFMAARGSCIGYKISPRAQQPAQSRRRATWTALALLGRPGPPRVAVLAIFWPRLYQFSLESIPYARRQWSFWGFLSTGLSALGGG
jgi:hypothetical protein